EEAVDGVRPIDHRAAPDHQREEREVDPVEPPDGQPMLALQPFHVLYNAGEYEKVSLRRRRFLRGPPGCPPPRAGDVVLAPGERRRLADALLSAARDQGAHR